MQILVTTEQFYFFVVFLNLIIVYVFHVFDFFGTSYSFFPHLSVAFQLSFYMVNHIKKFISSDCFGDISPEEDSYSFKDDHSLGLLQNSHLGLHLLSSLRFPFSFSRDGFSVL